MKDKSLLTFKCYPAPRLKTHYIVKVFPSQKDMHEFALTSLCIDKKGIRGALGLCSSMVVRKNDRIIPMSGYILLIQGYLGSSIVTHECLHAVLSLAKKFGLDLDEYKTGTSWAGDGEETACHWLGYMVSSIYSALYKHKIIDS